MSDSGSRSAENIDAPSLPARFIGDLTLPNYFTLGTPSGPIVIE
jgi:hypothetical protein